MSFLFLILLSFSFGSVTNDYTFLKRDQLQLTLMTSFCFMMFLIFSIVRPYRNDIYNYFDIFILFDLTVIDFLSNGKLNFFLWIIKVFLLTWPSGSFSGFLLRYWMALLTMLYRGAIRNKCFRI